MKLGIDLGTSYSRVAIEDNGKIEMTKVFWGNDFWGSFSMPAAVYMDKGHLLQTLRAGLKGTLEP